MGRTFRIRDIFRRKEFVIALSLGMAVFMVSTFCDLLTLAGSPQAELRPAWYYFGLMSETPYQYTKFTIQVFFLLFAPALPCLAYSYCYYDEYKFHLTSVMLPRLGRGKYFFSMAGAVFLAGFLVIFLPMFFSQLVFLTAVPSQSIVPVSSYVEQIDPVFYMQFWRGLAVNHPYLYSFIYCMIPACFCSLLGMLSFSFSLFVQKNRFLVIALPYILYLVIMFGSSLLGLPSSTLPTVMIPDIMKKLPLTVTLVYAGVLILLNLLPLLSKVFLSKDEL